ncbi:hypothetical protein ACPW96_02425 [Micromonospora sp. DT81.3]|uniref:hypothetical protein n=1 Tax=Micromonospora sp. DT81.3 TaxID=3416523 RepID=UPI003CF54D74
MCATMLAMDLGSDDELRMLRARAYGPSADIGNDPAALERLRALEELARAGSESPPDAAGGGAEPARVTTQAPAAPVEPIASAAEDPLRGSPEAPETPAPRSRRLSRRIAAVWAISVVVAAAVAAAVTFAVASITPVSRDPDARQIATLRAEPGVDLPGDFFGLGVETVVFEFYGLTIVRTDGGVFSNGTGECLTVVATQDIDPDSPSINGPVYYGCRAGGFPATVQLDVDATTPSALRDRVAQGSALLFVLDGELVGVFSDEG